MGLSAIFGGSAAMPNFSGANTYMSSLGSIAGGLGRTANAVNNTYANDSVQNNSALNAYSQYLQANPATQQFNAQQTSNAEQGASEGATRAAANLDQNLASRGISPNSSMGVGGQAQIQEGLAANNANIQNQVGQSNIAQHNQNLGTLAGLWSGQTNNAFNQGNTLANEQSGIYSGLTNDADQQAMQTYQAQLNNQNANNAMFGQIGSALAGPLTSGLSSMFSGGGGGGSGAGSGGGGFGGTLATSFGPVANLNPSGYVGTGNGGPLSGNLLSGSNSGGPFGYG